MALITCLDCGRQISDAAPACPGCGRPRAANLGIPTVGAANLPPMGPPAAASAVTIPYPAPAAPLYAPTPAYSAAPPVFAEPGLGRGRGFRDHWWRGKIFVVLCYLLCGACILGGLVALVDTGGGAMLLLWLLGAGFAWLGDALSRFSQGALAIVLVVLGLWTVLAGVSAFQAESTLEVQMVAFWMGINLVFISYFVERRKEFDG